jgi:hypothetical protein
MIKQRSVKLPVDIPVVDQVEFSDSLNTAPYNYGILFSNNFKLFPNER